MCPNPSPKHPSKSPPATPSHGIEKGAEEFTVNKSRRHIGHSSAILSRRFFVIIKIIRTNTGKKKKDK